MVKPKRANKPKNPSTETEFVSKLSQTDQEYIKNIRGYLDEIAIKFIWNLPEKEYADFNRMFFQIEQAHWYFDDFLVDDKKLGLRRLKFEKFAEFLVDHCQVLHPMRKNLKSHILRFKDYLNRVPRFGCILLNEDCTKILLVLNWRGTKWTYPQGKISEGEEGHMCAAREVYEEIGYHPTIDPTQFISVGDDSKMFIVKGVPEDFNFEPVARKEISKIKFFSLNCPPPNSYLVNSTVPKILSWIIEKYPDKALNTVPESVASLFSQPFYPDFPGEFSSSASETDDQTEDLIDSQNDSSSDVCEQTEFRNNGAQVDMLDSEDY